MKKRLSRLISSFHSSSCKSKSDVSPALPPIFSLPRPIGPKEEIQFSAESTAVSPEAVAASRCRRVRLRKGRRRSPAIEEVSTRAREYLWTKEEKWHVVVCSGETERTAIEECRDNADEEEVISSSTVETKEARPRISTSSCDSSCCITSEDEANDEREYFSTLHASLRNRTDAEEGKVGESFAVVKKSEDPRGDFRRSMAEMVAEKGMYEADDLEQLLHCFLSLNSRRHHRDIVAAFTDIWETLFPENSPTKGYNQ